MIKVKVISMLIVVGMLVAGLMYSQAKHISLWGDSLLKNDISVAIIYTQDKTYTLTNEQVVLDLTEKASKMKRSQKVESINFPFGSPAKPFQKFLLQTKGANTYGGTMWKSNTGNVLDSNGYYWMVSGDFISALELATKDLR